MASWFSDEIVETDRRDGLPDALDRSTAVSRGADRKAMNSGGAAPGRGWCRRLVPARPTAPVEYRWRHTFQVTSIVRPRSIDSTACLTTSKYDLDVRITRRKL